MTDKDKHLFEEALKSIEGLSPEQCDDIRKQYFNMKSDDFYKLPEGLKLIEGNKVTVRYIDANELMETIKTYDYLLVAHNNSIDRGIFTVGIQQVIDETPAADVEPVKREPCNACRLGIKVVAYQHPAAGGGIALWTETNGKPTYCPFCGRKLEEQ